MLGRLEVSETGQSTIRYDLMDGRSLKFADTTRADTPFVSDPFTPSPAGLDGDDGPELKMRAPTLWAALNLAARRPDGATPSVLISLTQNASSFAETCANLMDAWQDRPLPDYRSLETGDDSWARCLAAAADYFTTDSVEYRLLARGIALHHGKMPGLLARRLKIIIDHRYVSVIIATSTLSEGVNIPVNYLLIPSVYCANELLPLQEFSNLIGRAGRPGVATEGSALVVLPKRTLERNQFGQTVSSYSRQWNGYEELVKNLEAATTAAASLLPEDQASSPLRHLLEALKSAWASLIDGGTDDEFKVWLDQTAIAPPDQETVPAAYDYLDTLDAFLIASVEEIEELLEGEIEGPALEEELTATWRRTYAFAASHDEAHLAAIWLGRGHAIKRHYPDPIERRRLYRTSLSPRSARSLLAHAEAIRAKLAEGRDYAEWNTEQQFAFVQGILALLSEIPSFRIQKILGRKRNFGDWPKILRWWLEGHVAPATQVLRSYELVFVCCRQLHLS
jgi:hypothetical protein